ncbi:MAG: FAD-binding protein, partial [Blastocatellia bacterium]
LQGMGVKFGFLMHVSPDGNRVARHHVAEGSGRGLMVPLLREMFRRKEIEFRRSVYVEELIVREGRVAGVRGRGVRTGERVEVLGRAVVIATGGFGSNLRMAAEQWPASLPRARRMLGGSGVHSQGSGHWMAAAAGAELKDMHRLWIYPTGTRNPLPTGAERGIEVLSYYLWLDHRGGIIPHEQGGTLEHIESVLKPGGEYFWSICDAATRATIFVTGSDWQVNREEKYDALFNNPEIVRRGETLRELAEKMGVDPERLEASLAQYNSRAAVKLVHPPFYALQHFPLIRKTMGGIRTNLRSQVLTKAGDVIDGLYAAGEAAGFGGGNINGKRALEGTFLGPCVLTGRVAGREAAADALRIRMEPRAGTR